MNHLLHQLEMGGYLTRQAQPAHPSADPEDRRTHLVRLTEQGWAADGVINQTLARLDADWRQALGDDVYHELAQALGRLEEVLAP
jgi:DNA-binding MarR family transcriptional regulator